jgi:hypothetical protein
MVKVERYKSYAYVVTTKRPLKTAMIQVRVTKGERSRWIDAASRAELTLAELVREAVRLRISRAATLFTPTEEATP